MKITLADRRKAPRIPVDMKVKYRAVRGMDVAGTADGFELVQARNMSEYGMCITVPHEFQKDDILRVEFEINKRKVDAFCEVVWCRPGLDGGFEAGLEFDFMQDEDAVFIAGYLMGIMSQYGY